MNLLNDLEITRLVEKANMIAPFEAELVSKGLSYGLSSVGYDIRLSKKDFKIFKYSPTYIINPKKFNRPEFLKVGKLKQDKWGEYFVLPGSTVGLGVSVESFDMPKNVCGISLGKSTYARCGITPLVTPIEPGWKGHLVIELANTTSNPCRIYANEGVLQVMFYMVNCPQTTYADRNGKYQNQGLKVELAKCN